MTMQSSKSKKIEGIGSKIKPLLKRKGVIRCAFFGSFVRGEENKNSDIDLLVEFSPGKSLFDLIDLEMELEEKLARKIDVVTYDSLSPFLKERILKEQIQLL